MSGAGSAGAGVGFAGLDMVVAGLDSKKQTVIAMRYEGSSRDWELDANNNFRAVTANEQGVALSLSIKQGSIKSSPTTGNTLHEIEYFNSDDLGADISNRVIRSNPISRLVAANSISIDKIEYSTLNHKLAVAVYFRDLDVDPNVINRANWST